MIMPTGEIIFHKSDYVDSETHVHASIFTLSVKNKMQFYVIYGKTFDCGG